MASKDKDKDKRAVDEPEDDEAEAAPKQAFIKKLLGNRKLLMIASGGLLLLLIGIGAGVFFLVSGSDEGDQTEVAAAPLPATPPQIVFYDVPDLIVNIQTADGTPAYLKLAVTLELDNPDQKAGMQALMPRIVDQFQGYLRELRLDDIKGSAGIIRLKEELQRRVNAVTAPYRVREVLFKEMIVQ